MTETLDNIVDEIADLVGVYGCGPEEDHPKDCECRLCFTMSLMQRIRDSTKDELSSTHPLNCGNTLELAKKMARCLDSFIKEDESR